MSNRLNIYANLLKNNLLNDGCIFIMQKSETVSKSILMQFYHKNVPQQTINKHLLSLHCVYRMEYGKDIVTILLQEEM